MKGFIFEYYKYLRTQNENISNLNLPSDEPERTFLTFGDFDRLKINEIHEFDRYRDLSDLAKKWIGNRQSLLLYTLNDAEDLSYKEDENGIGLYVGNEKDNHLFIGLTSFSFLESKRFNYNRNQIEENLFDKIPCEMEKIIREGIYTTEQTTFFILGNLGDFGVSVLWMSNQFTEILEHVDRIKVEIPNTFQKVNTIFSINYSKNYDPELEKHILGNAFMLMTLKNSLAKALSANDIRFGEKVYHIPGEYDVAVVKDAKSVLKDFKENAYFIHAKDEYQKRFLQTKTILARNIQDLNIDSGDSEKTPELPELSKSLIAVEEYYNITREILKKKFPRTAGLIDTLDSLVCDYRYNVASATNQNWALDFSYIFEKNLQCIRDLSETVETNSLYKNNKSILLRKLLNNLKQQIFHISECSSMGNEVPKCHLRYTGQEDSILYAYMNIIKEILKVAYNLESVNKQTEIIPVITVDATPIIETDLYFDNSYMTDEEDLNMKILSVNLPHVSFYDIPNYMIYLYQEIFQHIVPRDREKRDFYMGCILTTWLFQDLLMEFLDSNIDFKKRKEFCEDLASETFEWVYKVYVRIHNDKIVENSKTNNSKLIAKNYVQLLLEFWKDNLSLRECTIECKSSRNHFVIFLKDLSEICINNEKYSKKSIFAKCVNSLEKYSDGKVCSEYLVKILDIKEDVLNQMLKNFEGLQKASADIAMIEMAEMEIDEYFVSYIIRQENLLDAKNMWKLAEHPSEIVRLKTVVKYYERQKRIDWEEFETNLRNKYIARKLILTKRESIKIDMDEFIAYIQYWIRDAIDILNEAVKTDYDEILMNCFLKEIQIKERIPSNVYDRHSKAKEYFGNYRNALNSYAFKIGRVIEKNNGNKLFDDYLVYQREVFTENIRLLQYFQQVQRLEDIGKQNKKCNEKKIVNCNDRKWQENLFPFTKKSNNKTTQHELWFNLDYNVSNITELMDSFESATRALKRSCRNVFKEEKELWYRGQTNEKHELLPSIMRQNERNKNSRNYKYLAEYQRHMYENFKYRAEGAPEMNNSSRYMLADYIALMQHYCVPTNFMDWSEDAFISTYFALEPLINGEQTNTDTDSAIYVFSPHLYNYARTQMIQTASSKFMTEHPVLNAVRKTAKAENGEIPNFSISYNEENYDMFLLGNFQYEKEDFYKKHTVTLMGGKEMAFLPIAAYTAKLNPRIKSQSGIFLVYNLYADFSSENGYSYMELRKIQNYYLKQDLEDKEPFLYKIKINRRGARDIALCFKSLGLEKRRIYPELDNIGQKIY